MVNDGLKCNHELDLEGTTLVQIPKRVMAYPPSKDCFCQCCKKTFKFELTKEGKFALVR